MIKIDKAMGQLPTNSIVRCPSNDKDEMNFSVGLLDFAFNCATLFTMRVIAYPTGVDRPDEEMR